MKEEITYSPQDLKKGKCTSCGEKSKEILIGDGRCIDCIEEQKFFERTMNQGTGLANQRSPFGIWS